MFVRTIFKGEERTYDCKKVLWKPQDVDENPNLDRVTIVLDVGEQDERVLIFECVKGNEFIIMNENGKTIDRKVW
jgi:hypothetical protein